MNKGPHPFLFVVVIFHLFELVTAVDWNRSPRSNTSHSAIIVQLISQFFLERL
jgi:hypothetical protein